MRKLLISLLISISGLSLVYADGENALKVALEKGDGKYLVNIAPDKFQNENVGMKMSLVFETCGPIFSKCANVLVGGLRNKNVEVKKAVLSEIASMFGDSYTRSTIAESHAPAIQRVCGQAKKVKDKDASVNEIVKSLKTICEPAASELLFLGKVGMLVKMSPDKFANTKGDYAYLAFNAKGKKTPKNVAIALSVIISPKADPSVKSSLLGDIERFVGGIPQSNGPLAEPNNNDRKKIKKLLEIGSKKAKDENTKAKLASLAASLK